jgi:hypothetical protein
MTAHQLAANVMNFAKVKPELHTGTVQNALLQYLIAACGAAPPPSPQWSRAQMRGFKYGETIPARFEPVTLAAIEAWAARNDVSRSEAVRRLVELGLKAKPKSWSDSACARL